MLLHSRLPQSISSTDLHSYVKWAEGVKCHSYEHNMMIRPGLGPNLLSSEIQHVLTLTPLRVTKHLNSLYKVSPESHTMVTE